MAWGECREPHNPVSSGECGSTRFSREGCVLWLHRLSTATTTTLLLICSFTQSLDRLFMEDNSCFHGARGSLRDEHCPCWVGGRGLHVQKE